MSRTTSLNSPCPQRCSISLKAKRFQHPGAVVSPKANQTSTSVNATTQTNGQATHKPNGRRAQNPPLDKSTASSRSLTNVNKLRLFRRPCSARNLAPVSHRRKNSSKTAVVPRPARLHLNEKHRSWKLEKG
ncbi:hypothetical protein CABS01_01144 [Colletotrichum abscissum]|uniref:uncharacterized protein n=1 Tax=Colletotrichum abscissum TaxID=1671311 RepID=UPI0027D57DBA|nr:uncharacterized protein CABS01_01144 [Colletotrichum abscissum]KAK1505676.1 hypothetical protein CABS01_01144 [Colletotrichum abscissum]